MQTRLFAAALCLSLIAVTAHAQITVDGTIEAGYGAAFSTDLTITTDAAEAGGTDILDIENLYLTDDGTNLYLALTVAGDLAATDWGHYFMYLTSVNITGTTNTQAWASNAVTCVSNYQVSWWVDFGGGADWHVWNDGGSTWDSLTGTTAGTAVVNNTVVPAVLECSVPLADLGNPSSVDLAIWTSGGTDNARDMLPATNGNGNSADWTTPTNITLFDTYTVTGTSAVTDWTVFE